jgi:hypothetical protein
MPIFRVIVGLWTVANELQSESLGAKAQTEWMTMRVEYEALKELAKSGQGIQE